VSPASLYAATALTGRHEQVYYIENTYQPISGYHEPIFKTRIKVVGGGGVGIYVRSQYERELCEKLTSIEYKVKHLEFVAVEVSLEDFWKVLIIGIFRPTGKTPTDILKELELIFKTALDTKLPVIIAGDFNIDVTNVNDALAKKYAALVNKYNLRMLVREPTRITSKSNALLDHILTNEEMTSEVTATVLDCQIAEHQVTIAEWY
jgi:exonuclease III